MIIIMSPKATENDVNSVAGKLREVYGVSIQVNKGVDCTVLGVLGNTHIIDMDKVMLLDNVEKVMPVSEPYKKASRKFHPEDSVIDCSGAKVGGKKLSIIAGPCSVESMEQITAVAKEVKASGASMLRGGAFKPRSSPYSFQGLELEGLDMLLEAKAQTGLPIVTEIMSPALVEKFDSCVDVIQVGARNMQNFDLLKELSKTRKPILLKRGLSATIEEWLMSAEYILAGGNPNVILCERGIRTFETYTRNTLDLSAVPAVKKLSHLPVIIDPSHATGLNWMVEPLAMAAVAVGADGLIIEVHNDPKNAKCDGAQSITPAAFDELMKKIDSIAPVFNKEI
ncbi:MAG: 3-deoxy-7-phosphoheptulonate synthase [Clostridia bacterium]|nr:3-deoxy-7-phosphoheptulonate synthase [Clostridia bacterium]